MFKFVATTQSAWIWDQALIGANATSPWRRPGASLNRALRQGMCLGGSVSLDAARASSKTRVCKLVGVPVFGQYAV